MTPKVAFTTLGCRLNQAESDQMAQELCDQGFAMTQDGEQADVVIINTCTVTREATKASRMAIRRHVRASPEAKVVVVGCYAVSDRAEVEAIEGVDMVLGNDEKENLVDAFGLTRSKPLLQVGFRGGPTGRVPVQVRANLKAQTGCDEWCTFCIIPTTRGPLRSMDEESLIAEARERVASGASELVLTGVHLGKYSYDQGGDERSLIRLFGRLLDIEGLKRLRLSSILSRHLTDEVVRLMAAEPRICPYLHVPLQSGDDGVLEAMNRPYDITEYVEALERTREMWPAVALATDVIVGFPGETEEAFDRTLDVVRRLRFSKLHVFRYSARPDTPAASMPDSVSPEAKRDRSKRLISLGNQMRQDFLQRHIGVPLEVLVEDEREVEGAWVASGHTGDHVRVWFEASGVKGQIVTVTGEAIRSDGIRGASVNGAPSDSLVADMGRLS